MTERTYLVSDAPFDPINWKFEREPLLPSVRKDHNAVLGHLFTKGYLTIKDNKTSPYAVWKCLLNDGSVVEAEPLDLIVLNDDWSINRVDKHAERR